MSNVASVANVATDPRALTEDQMVEHFFEKGFVIVPNLMDEKEVKALREFVISLVNRPEDQRPLGDTNQYVYNMYGRYEPFQSLVLKPKLLSFLTRILGEKPALLRESGAQFKNYSGWHKDTTGLARGGHTYYLNPDCLFVTGMFYLQDNDPDTGGGLDVEPGSNTKPDRYLNAKAKTQPKQSFFQKLFGKKEQARIDYGYDIADIEDVYMIPSKAGDYVCFDRKLDHRATPVKEGFTPQIDKIGLTASFSRNDQYLEAYHTFIGHRADYHFMRNFSYSDSFKEKAEQAGLVLV